VVALRGVVLRGLTEANISIAQSSIADTASPVDRNRLFGYVYLSASNGLRPWA
jgi:hypothetical protein